MSKATPLGAVAKFAAAGKTVPKKDLALQAIAYGNVYVARVAMGADPQQTLRAFREAEAYDGPSLVIAYSHCIAHGIEMRDGLDQQYRAVASGYWPLIRYDPVVRAAERQPVPARLAAAAHPAGRLHRAASCATARSPTPTRPRPSGCTASPQQAVAQRWAGLRGDGDPRRAASSPPTRARIADGAGNRATWAWRCATRSSRRRRRCRRPSTASGGSPTPASARSCSTRCSRSSCAARRSRTPGWPTPAPRASPSRCPTSRPAAEDEPGPRRYLSLLERAAAAVDVPVIGSLNGVTPGGWAGYARGDAGGRRRRDRAEHLLPARRPADLRPRGRAAAPRRADAGQGRRDRAGGGQARARTSARPARSRCGSTRPAPTGSCCSTASCSPTSTRTPSPWCPPSASRARPRPDCRGPGSRSCTAGCAPRSRRPRASRRPPTWPSTCLAGADVVMTDLGAAAPRPRARDRAARRPDRLDGPEGIRYGRARCAACSPFRQAPTRRRTSARATSARCGRPTPGAYAP